jgi:hypothetical protein
MFKQNNYNKFDLNINLVILKNTFIYINYDILIIMLH